MYSKNPNTSPLRQRAGNARDLCHDLVASQSLDELGEVFRHGLSRLVHADLHEIIIYDTGHDEGNLFIGTPGGYSHSERLEILKFIEENPDAHPVTKFSGTQNFTKPTQVIDIISLLAWRSSEFYDRYNRRWKHDHELDCILPGVSPRGSVALSIGRSSTPYNDAEVLATRLVIKPLIQTLKRLLLKRDLGRWVAGKSIPPERLLDLLPGLTPREAEVLSWLIEGKSDPEIALITGTKKLTASTHVRNVIMKLGVENRTAAGMLAVRLFVAVSEDSRLH